MSLLGCYNVSICALMSLCVCVFRRGGGVMLLRCFFVTASVTVSSVKIFIIAFYHGH